MPQRSVRFAVGTQSGPRSSEWLVSWFTHKSDVYVATRTLGGIFKASIHQSGVCHVRAPDPRKWRGPGPAPKFLDTWFIDPNATFTYPFGLVIPTEELREGAWAVHKDKGTKWLMPTSTATEVGVFLTREIRPSPEHLRARGWHTRIAEATLPDGRELHVLAGDASLPTEKREEVEMIKDRLRSPEIEALANPRVLLLANDEAGTRRFVEIAAK